MISMISLKGAPAIPNNCHHVCLAKDMSRQTPRVAHIPPISRAKIYIYIRIYYLKIISYIRISLSLFLSDWYPHFSAATHPNRLMRRSRRPPSKVSRCSSARLSSTAWCWDSSTWRPRRWLTGGHHTCTGGFPTKTVRVWNLATSCLAIHSQNSSTQNDNNDGRTSIRDASR